MKVVAGLGEIEDFELLASAGADEVFVGFVPVEYYEKYGNILPANRREVYFYHVQFTSYEDMKILRKMADEYGIAVSVTFNALYYSDEQMADLYEIMVRLLQIGFDRFIISDIGFLHFLRKKKLKALVEVSGELGELNHYGAIGLLEDFGAYPGLSRFIFQRKTEISAMKHIKDAISNQESSIGKPVELEAFLMNENCQFSGGYCNSMHCDEMVHMCLLSYECKRMDGKPYTINLDNEESLEDEPNTDIGLTGCGLCSLWKLREAGITHLKIVGRGLSGEMTVKNLLAVKRALLILDKSVDEADYISTMRKEIFPKGCSQNCYYPEQWLSKEEVRKI